MIRLLNAEPLNYSEDARRLLQGLGELDERWLNQAGLLECIGNYDVLIVRLGFRIDRELLEAGHRLRAIVTATTGLDHIDLAHAAQRGIAVLSLRGEYDFLRSVPATAEHTWALLLALIRHIPWAHASVLEGRWVRDAFRGHDLSGRRLGILGLGRIGAKIARYGLAFDMDVAAYDPSPAAQLADVKACGSMAELLRRSDVLSIHVPLTDQTHKLIGAAELKQLPPGALLVNTSRGAVMDEVALLAALASKRLAGAALDVINGEGDQHQLGRMALLSYARLHSNLLITPHIGGATVESMRATEVFMAEKLKRCLGAPEDSPQPAVEELRLD